ncbi:hypothetical protein [Poseidonocella sp. HB161398]|uniref:hypothetical protein n=1 Tax=Poseidonocella sp. HB161398 TaxID=2320855 RepID=UPI001107DF25|nr:hypothetical protein [Poseidonocella sp. HB161398]
MTGTTSAPDAPEGGVDVQGWAERSPLCPAHVDCAIAVALKVLDGKCKMPPHEAAIMMALYDAVRHLPAAKLGRDSHEMIARARAETVEHVRMDVYEARVLAETRISRPVMKQFKAMLRAEGVLPKKRPAAAAE